MFNAKGFKYNTRDMLTRGYQVGPSNTQLLADSKSEQGLSEQTDQVFEILSNLRRRQVLRYLRIHRNESPILLRALAEQIAAWENDESIASVTYKQRKRVYTSLYQSHLPRLHKYGFVEYDANRGTIELTPEGEELDIYLGIVPNEGGSWNEIYLGLSAVAITAVISLWFSAIPLVYSWHTLVLLLALFVGATVVHTIQMR